LLHTTAVIACTSRRRRRYLRRAPSRLYAAAVLTSNHRISLSLLLYKVYVMSPNRTPLPCPSFSLAFAFGLVRVDIV